MNKSKNIITISSYKETPIVTNVKKMGDYTYQDKNGKTYYISVILNQEKHFADIFYTNWITPVGKKAEDIKITKDESELNENKVSINVNIPDGKYKVKLPDGEIKNVNMK